MKDNTKVKLNSHSLDLSNCETEISSHVKTFTLLQTFVAFSDDSSKKCIFSYVPYGNACKEDT